MAYVIKSYEFNGIKQGDFCYNTEELKFKSGAILEPRTLLHVSFISSTGLVSARDRQRHWLIIPCKYLTHCNPTLWEKFKYYFLII